MNIPSGPARAPTQPVRVIVCAAHAHVQWGLKKVIDGEWPRLLLMAMVPSAIDAESFLQSHPTEVALLDFPERSEEAISRVEKLCRSFTTSFVILDGDDEIAARLTRAGVKAVLPLNATAERILETVYNAVGAPYEH